jgi:hypothetical protein
MTTIQPFGGWLGSYHIRVPNLASREWQYDTVPRISVPWQHGVLVSIPDAGDDSIYIDGADISRLLARRSPDGSFRSGFVPLIPGDHVLASSKRVSVQMVGYSHYDAYFLAAADTHPVPVRSQTIRSIGCASTVDTVIRIWNLDWDSNGVSSIQIVSSDAPGLSVTSSSLPVTLSPMELPDIAVTFTDIPEGITEGELGLFNQDDSLVGIIPFHIQRPRVSAEWSESDVDLGVLVPAQNGRDSVVWIYNSGELSLTIDSIPVSPPYTITEPSFPHTIQPGDSVVVHISATPSDTGEFAASLIAYLSPCHPPLPLQVHVRRVAASTPAINLVGTSPAHIRCPDATFDTARFTVDNPTDGPVQVDSIRRVGTSSFSPLVPFTPTLLGPGEELAVEYVWQSGAAGAETGLFRMYFGEGYDSIDVQLEGVKDSLSLDIPDTVVDMGRISQCADSLEYTSIPVRNSGNVPLVLSSLSTRLANVDVSTDMDNDTVQAGETFRLNVDPTSLEVGAWTDTLLLDLEPCSLTYRIPISYEIVRSQLTVAPASIDLGTVDTCQDDVTFEAALINDGSTADTILYVAGPDDSINVEYLTSSGLGPGDTAVVRVHIPIQNPGLLEREIRFVSIGCSDTATLIARADVTAPMYAVNPPSLDLGTLPSGATRRDTIRFVNVGTTPISIENIDTSSIPDGARISYRSAELNPVLPGDTLSWPVVWQSFRPDSGFITIRFRDGCPGDLMIPLRSRATPLNLSFWFPDTSAFVDDRIGIPLMGSGSSPYSGNFIVAARASWSVRSLVPDRVTSGGTSATIDDNVIAGDTRVLQLRYQGELPQDPGAVLTLDNIVLLGLQDTTTLSLTIDSIRSAEPELQYHVDFEDGRFTTLGICRVGGDRFVRIGPASAPRLPSPNPTPGSVTIPVECVNRPEAVSIAFYAVSGSLAARFSVDTKLTSTGHTSVDVDLNSLPDGLYHYRVSGSTCESEGNVVVQR